MRHYIKISNNLLNILYTCVWYIVFNIQFFVFIFTGVVHENSNVPSKEETKESCVPDEKDSTVILRPKNRRFNEVNIHFIYIMTTELFISINFIMLF